MLAFLVLTAVSFALLGFIIGIWAKNMEQLQLIPLLIVTPLIFLGGAFYSASMLPPFWACGDPVQPGALPDLGLPLVVLRQSPTCRWACRWSAVALFLGARAVRRSG